MSKFVGVYVQNKEHFGEVHAAGCRDSFKYEYQSAEFATPEEAKDHLENGGGDWDGEVWVTNFPSIFMPCVAKEVR
jgi:hypothetical protein